MRRAAWALALLALAACVQAGKHAATQAQEQEEDDSVPGVQISYALVQGGQVVGIVEEYHAESPLRLALGRRFGPFDDADAASSKGAARGGPAAPGARLVEELFGTVDAFSALAEQLLSGCPWARQQALARLQVEAALAAAGFTTKEEEEEDAFSTDPFALLGFPAAALEEPAAAAAQAATQGAGRMGHDGMQGSMSAGKPGGMGMGGSRAAAGASMQWRPLSQALRDGHAKDSAHTPHPAAQQLPTDEELVDFETVQDQLFGPQSEWEEDEAVQRPQSGAAKPVQPEPAPMVHRPPRGAARMADKQMALPSVQVTYARDPHPSRWYELDDPMPGSPVPPGAGIIWNLHDSEGRLNLGLVIFIALTVACVAVWAAMLLQYVQYRSAVANNNAATFFLRATYCRRDGADEDGLDADVATEDDLKPLLREGPMAGGVEVASAHVPASQRSLAVLHYEPVNGSSAMQ